MNALTQKLSAIAAQAKGTRWDVVASRTVAVIGFLAGLGLYAHLIPGKPGAIVAGGSAVAAAVLPRATKAAGIVTAAYGQQTPLMRVVPQLLSTLFSGPQILAQAKADAKIAEAKQLADQLADQQKISYSQFMNDAIDEIERRLKTGSFSPGELSQDVPMALKEAFQSLETQTEAPTPTITSTITAADKAPADA